MARPAHGPARAVTMTRRALATLRPARGWRSLRALDAWRNPTRRRTGRRSRSTRWCRSRPAPAATWWRGWRSTQLSQTLGQSIVIENKGGAGGTIGAGQVAKADPDGYSLLFHSSTHVIAPSLYTNLPYDTANDFAAVAPIGSVPSALVVSPSKGFRDLKDFVEKAKAKPGGLHLSPRRASARRRI